MTNSNGKNKNDKHENGNTHRGFDEFSLHADLLRAAADLGFDKPTPIQTAAIPPALEGKDVLACAMTGSGKTAAFVLPILHRFHGKSRGTTRALVLTPTRELAAQVTDHFQQLARHTKIRAAAVHGGVGAGPQEDAFRRGVDVIVGTPGRLLDHFQYGYAKLQDLEVLVMDEADRMLDMGFLPDIRRILKHLPRGKRQTLFYSATMPDPIVDLSRSMLDNPIRIAVERKSAPATGVTQAFYPVPSHLKVGLLTELLERDEIGNAIVFCRTKHRANRLAERLEKHGFPVGRIHGNRSQAQRTAALAAFKKGKTRVLVATDIVARGIDVEALDHVVNFDVPAAPEDYIHRVGRTARAEMTGDAFTLFAPEEEGGIRAIERAVGRTIERRRVEDFDYKARPEAKLEVPQAERRVAHRARKANERSRGGGSGRSRSSAPSRGSTSRGSTSRTSGASAHAPTNGDGPAPAKPRRGRPGRVTTPPRRGR